MDYPEGKDFIISLEKEVTSAKEVLCWAPEKTIVV